MEAGLYRRFGTAAQVMNAKELLRYLQQGEAPGSGIICSLQGIRPPTDAIDEDSTSSTAVVRLARLLNDAQGQTLLFRSGGDRRSAPTCTNQQTSSAFTGQLLRVASISFLLSATPVSNRSTDLFNLVSLVDPDQFRFEASSRTLLGANRPLVRLANQLKRPEGQHQHGAGSSGRSRAALAVPEQRA